jgi:hypothetical protein
MGDRLLLATAIMLGVIIPFALLLIARFMIE